MLGDAVCLSTCNRTEVYLAGDDGTRALSSLEEIAGEPLRSVAYRMHDDAAAMHLFRVSAGLDSLIPGESEILGQVRAAFDAASPGPAARPRLPAGARSSASASAPRRRSARARRRCRRPPPRSRRRSSATWPGRKVLLVGAGRIGELAAGNLSARGASIAYVANRSPEGAAELADALRRRADRARRRAGKLGEVDVVLTSTAAPGLVIEQRRRAVAPPPARCSSSTSPSRATSIPRCTSSTAATSTTSTTSRRSSPRRSRAAAPRPRSPSGSSSRRPSASASGGRRSTSCRRSPRCAPRRGDPRRRAREARVASRGGARAASTAVTAQILNKLLHEPTVRMKEAAADGRRRGVRRRRSGACSGSTPS